MFFAGDYSGMYRRINSQYKSTGMEYYYTTTFGSRVADGVYETLLEGE